MPPAPARLATLIAAALAAAGCSADAGGGETSTGRVVRVVDGDTIHVSAGGRREKVRYIGVDTPETAGGAPECFGRAARTANARLVEGERVRLVRDAEARDRYGRLLAYVYRERDGRFVNAELVRGGFAQPLTVHPNVRHERALARLAGEARVAGRGMWRACRSP